MLNDEESAHDRPPSFGLLHSPAYAGSHGCPSSAVVCYGGWIKPWRNAQRLSSDPSARTYGRRPEALAKEGMVRRVLPKTPEEPRLSSREAPLFFTAA